VRARTEMLLWFVFLVLPLLVGTMLHFVTGGPTFDLYGGSTGSFGGLLSKGESIWVEYGIIVEIPWIVVSGLVLFSTVKPEPEIEVSRLNEEA